MVEPPSNGAVRPVPVPAGARRISHSERAMPVLARLRERFAAARPLSDVRVVACLPLTAETAVLARLLASGGAEVALCSSNPLSTQDDVAAALRADGMTVAARRGVDRAGYYADVRQALDTLTGARRALLLDDGCDLLSALHTERPALLRSGVVAGACEQTATGVLRLQQMARDKALALPVVAVNDTPTKRVVDNRWGSGQSTVDALLRATGMLLAGRTAVVAGYGDVGRGVASRLRGLGASVIVTEVDPTAALDAALDGYRVLPMADAAPLASVVVTATGARDVVTAAHLGLLPDGAVLANAGHFDVEIDVRGLVSLAVERNVAVRPGVDEYVLPHGRRVLLVAEGRVAGLAAAEGSPPAVMDVAFALQALTAEWLLDAGLPRGVHPVPAGIDRTVAGLALESLGLALDVLTPAQEAYLRSWRAGS
ncbi:adenosylhomocysteinase [Motilibacter deserti]|uniref:Adenosylhomocysteinase n=1 Tax=Motilibacter deserti TaxID=2714956 RepID=A0ABX0GRF6_9ACTN|nr:adenosylhomocysteinase [Motilibacter deserti]NHC13058.1 adenosylhomocysteinase [Motilibacter deserti]